MNTNLNKAKAAKNDEYYTPITEVIRGVTPFRPQFRGKIVYCDCDDEQSAFYQYFKENFQSMHLKQLVASGIHTKYVLIYDGDTEQKIPLQNYGDYKSAELLPFIRGCDIICTNPPFSIFADYFTFLCATGKQFLVIGGLSAMTNKVVFPYIIARRVTPCLHKSITFLNGKPVPIVWYTNLQAPVEPMIDTGKKYDKAKYPHYDDYPDVIDVSALKDIPMDYDGVMGVPITFPLHWNPRQFEIVKERPIRPTINGKALFNRIFIRRV